VAQLGGVSADPVGLGTGVGNLGVVVGSVLAVAFSAACRLAISMALA